MILYGVVFNCAIGIMWYVTWLEDRGGGVLGGCVNRGQTSDPKRPGHANIFIGGDYATKSSSKARVAYIGDQGQSDLQNNATHIHQGENISKGQFLNVLAIFKMKKLAQPTRSFFTLLLENVALVGYNSF